MPIKDPGIAVQAAPLDTFVRTAEPEGFQVARALAELNPKLTNYLTLRGEFEIDQELARGRQRAVEDAADWQSATVRGERRLGENHWFRRAYRQQAGAQEGQRIAREATAAYAEWEDRDSDDPQAFGKWLSGFVREHTAAINDPDVIGGLSPELNVLSNNLSQVHAAYTATRVEAEGANAISEAVYDVLNNARNGPLDLQTGNIIGDFDPQIVMENYEALRDRFYATGVSRTQFDELFTNSVIEAAVTDLDAAYLAVLEMPRSDGTPAIITKAGMRERVADARNQIETRTASKAVRSAQTERAERERNSQLAFQTVASEFIANGSVSPETQREVALLIASGTIDPKQTRELFTALREGLGELDNPGIPQSDDDMPADFLLQVYEQGNVGAVAEAYASGYITDRSYLGQLLRAATSRRESEQSQDISRANLRFRQLDEDRSAVTRALLPVFNQAYGADVDPTRAPVARAELQRLLDVYAPHRERLTDQYAARSGRSAREAAAHVDSYVLAYLGHTPNQPALTAAEFEAEFGPGSAAALRAFNPVRRMHFSNAPN